MSDLEARFKRARTFVASGMPFFGYLLMKLQLMPEEQRPEHITTAAVTKDGKLYINPDFAARLSEPVFRWVLAHEVMHPAGLAWERLGARQALRWNIAHDYVINLMIEGTAGLERWPSALFDRKYEGWTTEAVYDDLPDSPLSFGMPDMEGGSEEGTPLDWRTAIQEAAQFHEKLKGKGSLPGGIQKYVDSLFTPIILWSEYVRKFVGTNLGQADFTYMRPGRRSECVGERLPGVRRTDAADITVLWDTSGSQNGWEKRVLSELQGLCEELGLTARVIVIDTEIHADVMMESAEDVIEHIAGGGGSDFCPAFERLEEERDESLVIAFTDGLIDVPQSCPTTLSGVLWVITEGGRTPAPWGETIHLNERGEVQ